MVRHSELLPDERILPLSLAVKAMIGVESLRTRPSGMVSFDNADGTKTIIGGSGTDQIATNAGDTQAPSRPTGLSATSTMQAALVHWDGTLEYGMVDDFDHIEIFAQPDGGDVLDIGYMRTAGELATGRLPVGSVVELWAVAADNAHDLQGNPSPNMSDESDHLVVTIDEPVDQNQIRETAEKLQKAADDAAAKADEAIKQGEQIRQDAQAGIDDARKQAQAAGDKADKAQNDLESQTMALKSSIAAVDAKADQVKAAGGKLSQKVDADKAALDKSIADVDAKAQAASDKGDRLAGQISDVTTTVNGHTTKLDELSTRIEGVASDGQVTVKSLTSLQQTVTGLSSTVTQNTKTASDAMSKASQVEQTANSISANLSKNYTTTADADEKYAAKTELKATADGLQANITRSQQTADGAVTAANKAQATADGFGATLSKDYRTAKASDEKYSTKAELKATSDGLSSSLSSVKQTADGAVTAASKAQQTADAVTLNLSKNYQTKDQNDALYATQTSLKVTSDSISSTVQQVNKDIDRLNSSSQNYIKNPQFKSGNTDDVANTSMEASDPDAGKLPGTATTYGKNTSGYDNICNNVRIKGIPGHTYRIEIDAKPCSDSPGHEGLGLFFWILTEDNPDHPRNSYTGYDPNLIPSSVTDWTHAKYDYVFPSNSDFKVIRPAYRPNPNDRWLVTNFTCTDITAIMNAANAANSALTKASSVEQNLNGFKTTVAETYQTKDGMSDYATNSSLTQTANSIKAQVTEVSKTANGAMSKATTVEQTANGLSSKITEQGKTLNATVKTANEAKSTADSNKATISQVSTTASNALTKAAAVEQNLNGFKTTVSETYSTKDDVRNLTISGTNLLLVDDLITCYVDASTGLPVDPYAGKPDGNWVGDVSTKNPIAVSANSTYVLTAYDSMPDTTGFTGRISQFDASGKYINIALNVTIRKAGSLEFTTASTAASIYVGIYACPKYRWKLEKKLQPAGDYATNSSLTQTANQIRGEVSEKYQSKDGMSSYATNSALTQKANEITGKVQEVAKTAQGNTTTISQVSQKADKINTTLSQKIDGKADVSRVSSLEQNLNGFKTTVSQTYTTKTDTQNLRQMSALTYQLTGSGGKAKWVKIGYLVSNGDSTSILLHVYSGDGYNGNPGQNAEFEIYIKDGNNGTQGAANAFGVSITKIRNADNVKVKVLAFNATSCDVWAYMPWDWWDGRYTIQGSYHTWRSYPDNSNSTSETEPTLGTAQPLAYDSLSTKSYVDQTAKSVALGVVQNYKGADGSGLATKSDITVAKDSITSTVAKTYATKSGVTQEISSKITQNNNSLDVKFSTKTETKNAQDTANTANSHASDAQSRIGSLEDCINMTSQGVRVGKRVNGKWSGWSALVNTGGSYDIFDGAGAKQATFSSGRLDLGKSSHNTNGIYVPAGGNWTSGWLCIDDYLVDCDHTRHIYACARGGLLCFKGRVALTNPNAAGDQRVIDGNKWHQAMQGKYSVYPYLDVDDDERDWPVTFKRSDNNLLAVGTLFIPRTTRDIWWYDPTRGKHTMWIDLNNLQIPMGNNVIG